MKSVLVIGGAGYIGSHVALTFLRAGYRVSILDNLSTGRQVNLLDNTSFIHADLQDRASLKDVFSQHYDGVIHLASLKAAGESMDIPEKYAIQNLSGSINLIEALSNSKIDKIIFSSSSAVYGKPKYLPMDESHPLNPINFYGYTKLQIERLLEWFDKLKGIKHVSLRYFNAAGFDAEGRITGLEQNPANLIPIVMEVAIGKREQVNVFGDDYPTPDGTGIRDYVHVTDLAEAHLRAFSYLSEKNESTSINLGTGKGYSVLEVIETSRQITNRNVFCRVVKRRSGDLPIVYSSSDRALKLLNWKPKFSDLNTIISTTWKIYENYTM